MRLLISLGVALINLLHIGTSLKIGYDVYQMLAPLAAAERGYTGAVGGEALVAMATVVIAYFVLDEVICAVINARKEK